MMKLPKPLFFRAVLTSGLAGIVLTVLNQWMAFAGKTSFAIGPAALTFLLLFTASMVGSYVASRHFDRQGTVIEVVDPCIDQLRNAQNVLGQIEGNARKVNAASKARATSLLVLIETARDLQAVLKGASSDVEENNSRLKDACDGVRDMDASIQRVLERLKDGQVSSSELTEAVEGLVQSAHAVEAASASVSEISRKTQLLAVNALIEASRAGAAGRGFSVVASQVGDLSSRTNQVVSEISEKMENQRAGLDQAQETLNQMLDHLLQSKTDSEGSIETATRVRTDVEGSASVASSVANVMVGQAAEFDNIVEFLIQIQKDTEAAVSGSATNISLAEAAKQSVSIAMGEKPNKTSGSETAYEAA